MKSFDSEKTYSIWQVPVMAFWSKNFYSDVFRNWRGIGLIYISIVSFIFAACIGVYLQLYVQDFDDAKVQALVSQVPNITIDKGTLSSDVKQPYVVKFDDEPYANFILDTTGEVTSLPDDAIVLITQHRIITRKRSGGAVLQVYDLDDIDYFEFDRNQLTPWLHTLRDYLPIVIAIFSFIFVLISYLFKALFYTVVVMLFTKSRYEFKSIFRLSVFALTPGFILDYALVFLIGLPWSLIFLINIGYVTFAIKSISKDSEVEDGPEVSAVALDTNSEKLAL